MKCKTTFLTFFVSYYIFPAGSCLLPSCAMFFIFIIHSFILFHPILNFHFSHFTWYRFKIICFLLLPGNQIHLSTLHFSFQNAPLGSFFGPSSSSETTGELLLKIGCRCTVRERRAKTDQPQSWREIKAESLSLCSTHFILTILIDPVRGWGCLGKRHKIRKSKDFCF